MSDEEGKITPPLAAILRTSRISLPDAWDIAGDTQFCYVCVLFG